MSQEFVISLAEKGVFTVLVIAGPLLLIALGIGLAVSIFQATTLKFVPKIVGVLVALIVFGPWMLSHMLSFASEIYGNLYRFIG